MQSIAPSEETEQPSRIDHNDGASSGSGPTTSAVTALKEETLRLKETVERFYPEEWKVLEAALAVHAVGLLKDNTQPIALFFVGPPGAGKTMALMWLTESGDAEFYRSDKFTTASFVSHRADKKKKQLEENDLLPQIKDKTLVTPELASTFHGERQKLEEQFALLARVLDGNGLVTNSGAQGRRDYSGKYNFRWLGATTPLEPEALEVMGNVGPRLVFFEVDRPHASTEELAETLASKSPSDANASCVGAVLRFLKALRRTSGQGLSSNDIDFPEPLIRQVAALAKILTLLRAPLGRSLEHPERVAWILKHIAMGHALVWGRRHVTQSDMKLLRHIVLSSGVPGRGRVLRALTENGFILSQADLIKAAGMSENTVRAYVRELQELGIVSVIEGGGRGNPTMIYVQPEWAEAFSPENPSTKTTEGAASSIMQ